MDVRQELIETARRMESVGLNRGTAGNLSVRALHQEREGFFITPTGMPYDTLTVDDIVFVCTDGSCIGKRQPSSEWRFHHDIYLARAEAGAILHAHSPFATSVACLRQNIPAFHYMIARFGGDSVRCADYATFGTQSLSDAALAALAGRNACLLANHGMLVFGRTIAESFALGIELEGLCEQFWRASLLGKPALLDAQEMATVLAKFKTYGQQKADR